ncbi:class I SAM-dependent methyltransferase [Streptomyces roseirectus]|uniref:Class I SAM-dependent methyltransferase n=1 Tax=Streptomyces roseirectus TaxID=2768066 RepID=A0A7H0IK13_9ACTN|nr:class I SAM-dependent methyltransferase [Streptomyces roseirectus]QNP73129.1 class I SAM-dependent methyltransferase [Streptomyces roseirectus]
MQDLQEPRRTDCPWCGSRHLRTRRPGTPAVDECQDCAHTFRNPGRPAPHRRDIDDGLLTRVLAARTTGRRLRATARAMTAFPEPESWLDVGTGHARFPEAAKDLFAYTSFDGVDPTPRVDRARAEGRVEEAHRALTPALDARYDVVSVLHHLAHAPDPRAELTAALRALRPGGHLLLELPDPACAFAPLLGKWWLPYGRSHHLHLIPLDNLRTELEAQGCEIVTTDRRAAHVPYDLAAATALLLTRHVPPRARRLTTPLTALAAALDHTLSPLLRRTRFSNAYRVIARKRPA